MPESNNLYTNVLNADKQALTGLACSTLTSHMFVKHSSSFHFKKEAGIWLSLFPLYFPGSLLCILISKSSMNLKKNKTKNNNNQPSIVFQTKIFTRQNTTNLSAQLFSFLHEKTM